MHPKVFISHASEDKDRFVLAFAERLRASGVDVWLDRWEMLPGDSLVDKIFEEGLRNAAAVIVVLSNNSVNKPWVREEINAAFVKRVNSGSKLIPVVLDACRVPEALASTLWERIDDVSAYDTSFERLLAAVVGARDKPPLGQLPGYVSAPICEIGGLARIDNLVLKTACERVVRNGHDQVDGSELLTSDEIASLPEQEIDDSLKILEREHLVKLSRFAGIGLPHFRITMYGFQQYAKAYVPDYESSITQVASAVVNNGLEDNKSIQQHVGKDQFLVDHALEVLENQGYVRLSRTMGGHTWIIDVSPALKRALAS